MSGLDDTPTLRELRKISRILMLANASVVEKELSKIANSDARRKMWVLIDGIRMQKDIAKEVGVTQAAVSYFLTAASAAEFIEYTHGKPPRRILDYVPPSWIDLIVKEKGEVKQEAPKEGEKVEEQAIEKKRVPEPTEESSTMISGQQTEQGQK
jgi:hypothetical protein